MAGSSDRVSAYIAHTVGKTAPARSRYFTRPTVIDRCFQYSILLFIPNVITPNLVTFLRYLSIPFVVVLLMTGELASALVLFSLAALSDAVDGALARTRGQVTEWGILNDPLADKLLIASVAVVAISRFLSVWLAVAIVVIELVLVASAYMRYTGTAVPAKTVGKIKMVLQSLGVIVLLTGVVLSAPVLINAAQYTLYGAIAFALLSLVVYRSI